MAELDIHDLDRISALDADGNVGVLIGLGGMVYYSESWKPDHRRALADWIGRLMDMTSSGAWRWYLRPTGGHPTRFTRGQFDEAMQELLGERGANLGALAWSGDDKLDAGHFSLNALTTLERPSKLGYIGFTLPLGWAAQRPDVFPALFRGLCRIGTPFHGYAGLWIIRHPYGWQAPRADLIAYPYAARFPGLELDSPSTHSLKCRDGIKGVNWLTFVGDTLLERLGGRAGARGLAAAAAVPVEEYPKGMLFQAGPVPQIGDLEAGLVPEAYRTVARLLKPLRSPHKDIIIHTPPGIDARAFAQTWLSRFD